jgi:hypothetical protein
MYGVGCLIWMLTIRRWIVVSWKVLEPVGSYVGWPQGCDNSPED